MTSQRVRHIKVHPEEHEALLRLLQVAARDTGQSGKVADFLLAWWNAKSCGGFDITSIWGMDDDLVDDVITVFRLIARCNSYPDTLGYTDDFKQIIQMWRPELKN